VSGKREVGRGRTGELIARARAETRAYLAAHAATPHEARRMMNYAKLEADKVRSHVRAIREVAEACGWPAARILEALRELEVQP